MKTRIILIITLFFVQFQSSKAGFPGEFGFRAAGGLSKIIYKYRLEIHSHDILPAPSWQAGVYYRHKISKRLHVGSELNYSSVKGLEKFVFNEYDEFGNPTGLFSRTTYSKSLSYLSLPIYAGVSLGRFDLNLGFQYNHLLESHGRTVNRIEQPDGSEDEIIDEFRNLDVSENDYGLRAAAVFRISKKFSVDASAYYGLKNIYVASYNPLDWHWKVRQMTVGLRYAL